ncbi:MAG TPA: PD-(D/E)XK nuclease family protein [Nitrospinota bacterium]|nr:PD-(D/E)XK nuclease family protein [Nitrospinota bacterium]
MSPEPLKRLVAAPFHHLEAYLPRLLEEFAEGDRLRARRVVVISNHLRDHLQVLLASGRSLAGVSVLTLGELIREVPRGRLLRNYPNPLPPLGGAALAERALAESTMELGPLRPPEGALGYGDAAFETWKDLEEALISAKDLLGCAKRLSQANPARAARLKALARLAAALEEGFGRHGFHSEAGLLRSACEAVEAAPPRIPTIFYGFADMNALQRRFALALCRAAPAAALVPAERGAPACEFARPFLGWLEARGFTPEAAARVIEERPLGRRPLGELCRRLFSSENSSPPGGGAPPPDASALRVVSAPSASREAFELCREFLHADAPVDGGEGRIGVLPPGDEPYTSLFREVFRGIGLPAEAEDNGHRAATRAGRLFLLMLSLGERGYPRREVIRFLDEGRFSESKIFRVEISAEEGDAFLEGFASLCSKWEILTRRLAYISGADEWRTALASGVFRKTLKDGGARLGEPLLADLLEKTLERLFALLGGLPERALPSAHAAAAMGAFGSLTALPGLGEKELESIADLGGLDPILGEIDAAAFRRWSRAALENKTVPAPNEGGRVRLLSLQHARGLSFDTVVIPGMAEGAFPARGAEDPLLPDYLRAEINEILSADGEMARLPLKASRSGEDRFLFWTALQAARRRVILGYPRGVNGAGEGAERPPGLFLEYIADACAPGEGDAETRLRSFPGYRDAPTALEPAVIGERPLSLLEYDFARLMKRNGKQPGRGTLSDFPEIKRGFNRRIGAWRERWIRDALTPFDGVLTAPDLIGRIRGRLDPEKNHVAVTALERFFECPYRFALSRLFDLGAEREPELALEAAPDARGRLYHSALQRFAERVGETGGGFGELSETRRGELIEAAVAEACREFEADDRPPLPVPWGILRRSVENDLNRFFEINYSGSLEWAPVETEGWIGGERSPRFALAEGGEKVHLIGRFDLMERSRNRRRFIDYKTGRANIPKKGAPSLAGGARLQPDLYAHCAGDRFGADTRVSAAYAFPTERGEYRLAEIPPKAIEERRGEVSALLGFYVRAVGRGHFFPTPFPSFPGGTCGYCEFTAVCGPDRAARAARKSGSDPRAELDALRERTK